MIRLLIAGIVLACAGHAQPARIVSTSPSITETLFALDLGDRVVGVSNYCRYPPAVLSLPKIGTYIRPDPEKIALLHPDLVIIHKSAKVLAGKLSALKISYAEVKVGSLADVYSMISDIGRAAGVADRAAKLNQEIQARLDGFRMAAQTRAKPTTLIIVGRNPGTLSNLVAVSAGPYLGELLDIAGGANVITEATIAYPHISLETVLRLNPDVILDLSITGASGGDLPSAGGAPPGTLADSSRIERCSKRADFRTRVGGVDYSGTACRRCRENAARYDSRKGPSAMSALLAVREVSYQYPGHPVLDSVTFSADGGEFVVVLGVNGAGKSTLLDIVAGLRAPDSGNVFLGDRDVRFITATELGRRISHLPQGIARELPFTVEQVVLMGRYAHADRWFESEEDHAYAKDAMYRMDCLQFADRLYSTLSGGEQQRVLLAACIAQCPTLMLFDEPSTYLDVHQQLHCFSTLAELAREGALCIAVSHDLNLALAHCTRVLILDRGKLAADFTTQEAASRPEWLSWLSPRLRMTTTPDGKPWVLYQ